MGSIIVLSTVIFEPTFINVLNLIISVNLLPRVHANPSEELKLRVARWSVPVMAAIALYTAFNTATVISAIAAATLNCKVAIYRALNP